jgi:ketosteroid isomerase-like protein
VTVSEFLDRVLPQFTEAEISLHTGEVDRRLAMWSRGDPVTLFGAGKSASTAEEIEQVFRWVASTFVECNTYDLELVAAGVSGDIAYTVTYESYEAVRSDGSVARNRLRATHVFRREGNEWKIVHRHADHAPEEH